MAASTEIQNAKVTGRRTVRYESYDDILADAERLAKIETKTLGNWSQGQIYKHMAIAISNMLDGFPFSLPLPLQWLFTIFMKKRMLARTLDPGFKLPKKAAGAIPGATSTAEGLAALREAIARIQATDQRQPHPGFGKIPKEEWDAFQFRHCEMHMGFIVPKE